MWEAATWRSTCPVSYRTIGISPGVPRWEWSPGGPLICLSYNSPRNRNEEAYQRQDDTYVRTATSYDKKGKSVEQQSYAFSCFRGESVPSHPESVPAEGWIESWNLIKGSRVLEESRSLPSYRSVPTLIWIKDRLEKKSDYDDDEGDPLGPFFSSVFMRKIATHTSSSSIQKKAFPNFFPTSRKLKNLYSN